MIAGGKNFVIATHGRKPESNFCKGKCAAQGNNPTYHPYQKKDGAVAGGCCNGGRVPENTHANHQTYHNHG